MKIDCHTLPKQETRELAFPALKFSEKFRTVIILAIALQSVYETSSANALGALVVQRKEVSLW